MWHRHLVLPLSSHNIHECQFSRRKLQGGEKNSIFINVSVFVSIIQRVGSQRGDGALSTLLSKSRKKQWSHLSKHSACRTALSHRRFFCPSPLVIAFATGPMHLWVKMSPHTVFHTLPSGEGGEQRGLYTKDRLFFLTRFTGGFNQLLQLKILRSSGRSHPVIGQSFFTPAVGVVQACSILGCLGRNR